jgi:hypothetical protein
VIAFAGAIAAFVTFSLPGHQGCELAGTEIHGYQARFLGKVSVTQTAHDLLVTDNGSPVTQAPLCINTQMTGMSGMGYTNQGRDLGLGRYRVNFQFGMAGDYTGNVVVTKDGNQISIPVKVKVTQPGL